VTRIDLSIGEIDSLLDALAIAASRRESMGRALKHGRKHDLAAERMRALRHRLLNIRRAKGREEDGLRDCA
jgi:hypothetical protein